MSKKRNDSIFATRVKISGSVKKAWHSHPPLMYNDRPLIAIKTLNNVIRKRAYVKIKKTCFPISVLLKVVCCFFKKINEYIVNTRLLYRPYLAICAKI